MNEEEIKNILDIHEKRITELEAMMKNKESSIEPITDTSTIDLNLLSKKGDIPENKLRESFDFDGNNITILKVCGKDVKDQTQNVTLLILLAYKYIMKKDDLLSQEIRRNVAINSVPVNNFGTYINELSPSLIMRKGKPKSSKTKYRLTVLGEAKAKEKLKEITQ